MNSDASVLKWAAVVGVVIIGCFCLGFFLGPNLNLGPGAGNTVASNGVPPAPNTERPRRNATITDDTDAVERENRDRQRQKSEKAAKDAERKRLEKEAEEQRKADEKAKEDAAKLEATPTPEPTTEPKTDDEKPRDGSDEATTDKPKPGASDNGNDEPSKPRRDTPRDGEGDSPKPDDDPKPEERPRVRPTPRPTPRATPRPARQGFRVRLDDSPDEGVARRRADEVRNATGMPARVVTETVGGKKRYRVQVDAKDRDDANRKAEELRNNGYNGSVDD